MSSPAVCPFCRYPIKDGSRLHRCTRCRVLHHEECWRENGGCTTYGCRTRSAAPASDALPVVCPICGNSNRERERVCWACSADLPRPETASTPPTPTRVPPPHIESLPDLDLSDDEVALRQETFEALLAVQSALELGVTAEKYSTELLKAKQTHDRLRMRSSYEGSSLFWIMGQRLIMHYQQALVVWHLKFQVLPGTQNLITHIDVASELGTQLLPLYPALTSFTEKRNIWLSTSDRWSVDNVLQVVWAEARSGLEELRTCLRK